MTQPNDECYTGTGPDELWLQLHGDCTPDELTEPVDYTSGDVTWCWHRIHDSDVRYVRADLAQANALSPTYAELLAQRDELAKALECVLRDHLVVHGVGDVEMQPSLFQARAALSRIKGA